MTTKQQKALRSLNYYRVKENPSITKPAGEVLVENFLIQRAAFPRLECAINANWSDRDKAEAQQLDEIDFYYRRFLIGLQPDLRRVHKAFKGLMPEDIHVGLSIMEEAKEEAVKHELYEIVIYHADAVEKVLAALAYTRGNHEVFITCMYCEAEFDARLELGICPHCSKSI